MTSSPDPSPPPIRRVIVAGFGPVGRVVTEGFERDGAEVVILEMNERTVATQRELGRDVHHGDATKAADLEAAGVAGADALVLAIPDEEDVLEACRVARELAPDLYIVARTNFVSAGLKATALGADHVTVEEVATAEAMRAAVIERRRDRAPSG